MEYASFAYQVREKTSGGRKLKERSWQTTTTEERYWKRRAGHSWRQWLMAGVALTTVFKDIPVQICQFHQMKQVPTKSTRRPETRQDKNFVESECSGFRGVMKKNSQNLLSDWKNDHGEIPHRQNIYPRNTKRYYTHKKLECIPQSRKKPAISVYIFTISRTQYSEHHQFA